MSHLFQVAAGLDSMAVGEAQILGQTRDALARGQEAGTVGPALNVLFQQALRVGKRAHAETGIDQAAPTLVSAALDRVGDVSGHRLDDLSGRTVVVGAGSIAALATATLVRRGATDVVVVNRSPHRAARLAAEHGVRAAALADLAAEIEHADLVVACTGSTGVLLTTDMVASLSARPLDVVDLALPHDVEPGVGELPGVTLVTLADLADDLADSDGRRRGRRRPRDRHPGGRGVPRRAASGQRDADRRRAALDGHRGRRRRAGPAVARLPDLDDASRAEVLQSLRRVADKLLHQPTVRVKELANETGAVSYAAALAELFALDPDAVEAVTRPEGPAPHDARD